MDEEREGKKVIKRVAYLLFRILYSYLNLRLILWIANWNLMEIMSLIWKFADGNPSCLKFNLNVYHSGNQLEKQQIRRQNIYQYKTIPIDDALARNIFLFFVWGFLYYWAHICCIHFLNNFNSGFELQIKNHTHKKKTNLFIV